MVGAAEVAKERYLTCIDSMCNSQIVWIVQFLVSIWWKVKLLYTDNKLAPKNVVKLGVI